MGSGVVKEDTISRFGETDAEFNLDINGTEKCHCVVVFGARKRQVPPSIDSKKGPSVQRTAITTTQVTIPRTRDDINANVTKKI